MNCDKAAQDAFYAQYIEPYLPPLVLDFHTHIWRADQWRNRGLISTDNTTNAHAAYMSTATDYPAETLLRDGDQSFPGRYEAVVFGQPTPAVIGERTNDYVAASARPGLYPLMIAGTGLYDGDGELEAALERGRFLGYKVYLNWIGDDYGALRVEDMLTPAQLELADGRGLVVLLHVPRARRMADPEVQRGVQDIARRYPGMKLVLAHCGRCYLPEEMLDALPAINKLPQNVWLDTSMVMDPYVLALLMDAIGPSRLLFATDYPVAAMHGRRVAMMDHWTDLVRPLYSEAHFRVSSDNTRAMSMAREIARAVIAAAKLCGLSEHELHGIFYGNGRALLG